MESTNGIILEIFSFVNKVPFVIIPIVPLNRSLVYSNNCIIPFLSNGSPPVKTICNGFKVRIFSTTFLHPSKFNASGKSPAITLQCLHLKLHLFVIAKVIYLGISPFSCLDCVTTPNLNIFSIKSLMYTLSSSVCNAFRTSCTVYCCCITF